VRSVYLQAVTGGAWLADRRRRLRHHAVFYLVSGPDAADRSAAALDRWGPRPVLLLGAVSMTLGVAAIGQVTVRWQLYPCFVLIGLGWAALSTTGIAATVAPWFERHQGRSMASHHGASVGAIVGVPALQFAIRHFGFDRGMLVVGAVGAVLFAAADRPHPALPPAGGDRACIVTAHLARRAATGSRRTADRDRGQSADPAVERRGGLSRSASRCRSLHHPIT